MNNRTLGVFIAAAACGVVALVLCIVSQTGQVEVGGPVPRPAVSQGPNLYAASEAEQPELIDKGRTSISELVANFVVDPSIPGATTEVLTPARSLVEIEMRYAGKDRSHLIQALNRLSPLHMRERDRLIQERWDFGVFESRFVPEGEQVPPVREADGSTPSFGFKCEPVVGGMILKTTVLDSATYPEFAMLEREANWLRSQIGPGYTSPETH